MQRLSAAVRPDWRGRRGAEPRAVARGRHGYAGPEGQVRCPLSFLGAIDTRHALPFGTPVDVKREVARRIADLAPGDGFILAPVQNVQADVPPENLVTMYRHARRVGTYPIRVTLGETA